MSEHSRLAEAHIDSIVKQEEEVLERRSHSERFADSVGVFAGSLTFVVLHLLFLVAWVLMNSGKISGVRSFDRYPFSLLGVIVAVEAVFFPRGTYWKLTGKEGKLRPKPTKQMAKSRCPTTAGRIGF
jgi:uncharacterized membrane protein